MGDRRAMYAEIVRQAVPDQIDGNPNALSDMGAKCPWCDALPSEPHASDCQADNRSGIDEGEVRNVQPPGPTDGPNPGDDQGPYVPPQGDQQVNHVLPYRGDDVDNAHHVGPYVGADDHKHEIGGKGGRFTCKHCGIPLRYNDNDDPKDERVWIRDTRAALNEFSELEGLYQRQHQDLNERGINNSGQEPVLPCGTCGKPATFDKLYLSFPSAHANYRCPEGHETHYKPDLTEEQRATLKAQLPKEGAAAPGTPVAPPRPDVQGWRCRNCGSPVAKDSARCANCGQENPTNQGWSGEGGFFGQRATLQFHYHPGPMDERLPEVVAGTAIGPGSDVEIVRAVDPTGARVEVSDGTNRQSVWRTSLYLGAACEVCAGTRQEITGSVLPDASQFAPLPNDGPGLGLLLAATFEPPADQKQAANVHVVMHEDSNGDLVDIDHYHHFCAQQAGLGEETGWPAPESQDSPVYCKGCGERIHEIPLTEEGRAEYGEHEAGRANSIEEHINEDHPELNPRDHEEAIEDHRSEHENAPETYDHAHDHEGDYENGRKTLTGSKQEREAAMQKHAPYGIPKDKGGDSEKNDSKMEDCVDKVMKKGHPKDHAIRICKKSLGFTKDSGICIGDLPEPAFTTMVASLDAEVHEERIADRAPGHDPRTIEDQQAAEGGWMPKDTVTTCPKCKQTTLSYDPKDKVLFCPGPGCNYSSATGLGSPHRQSSAVSLSQIGREDPTDLGPWIPSPEEIADLREDINATVAADQRLAGEWKHSPQSLGPETTGLPHWTQGIRDLAEAHKREGTYETREALRDELMRHLDAGMSWNLVDAAASQAGVDAMRITRRMDDLKPKQGASDRCPRCGGSGKEIVSFEGDVRNTRTCTNCQGSGRNPEGEQDGPCPVCGAYDGDHEPGCTVDRRVSFNERLIAFEAANWFDGTSGSVRDRIAVARTLAGEDQVAALSLGVEVETLEKTAFVLEEAEKAEAMQRYPAGQVAVEYGDLITAGLVELEDPSFLLEPARALASEVASYDWEAFAGQGAGEWVERQSGDLLASELDTHVAAVDYAQMQTTVLLDAAARERVIRTFAESVERFRRQATSRVAAVKEQNVEPQQDDGILEVVSKTGMFL
jgi:hypothetical protein